MTKSKQFREWWIFESSTSGEGIARIEPGPGRWHVIQHEALLAEQERAKGLVEVLGKFAKAKFSFGDQCEIAREALRKYGADE